jgi:hypothetical protein
MDTLMDSLLPVLVIVVLGLVVLTALAKITKRGLTSDLYKRNDELFSPAEARFLATLDAAVSPAGRVFGKVRVADLVHLKKGLNPKVRQAALNRVAQKHFDFVVCSAATLAPLCAVELNDSSHGSQSAKRRDDLLANICDSISLPLLTVRAAGSYSVDALRAELEAVTVPKNGRSARNVA